MWGLCCDHDTNIHQHTEPSATDPAQNVPSHDTISAAGMASIETLTLQNGRKVKSQRLEGFTQGDVTEQGQRAIQAATGEKGLKAERPLGKQL